MSRIDYRYGDIVELAADLPPADVVTLDSVICCYPYLAALLQAAMSCRPLLVGQIYPRDVWWMLGYMRLLNALHARWRSPARSFIHGAIYEGGSRGWRVVVCRRARVTTSEATCQSPATAGGRSPSQGARETGRLALGR